jgi:ABC-type multidrug transport system permease subunit
MHIAYCRSQIAFCKYLGINMHQNAIIAAPTTSARSSNDATCSAVFSYLLAAVCSTVEAANGLVPCIVISLLFFAGCLLRDVDIPRWWHWFSYLDPLRYAFGALMVCTYFPSFFVTLA